MRARRYLPPIVAICLTWALRLNKLFVLGVQADEGVHVSVAEQLAHGNGPLYRALFENRTPGVEWLLSLLFRLAGPDVDLARLLAAGMACLTSVALYRLVRRAAHYPQNIVVDDASAFLAALLFATAPLAIVWGRFAMLEHFSTAAATVSIVLAVMALDKDGGRTWLLSGLAAGAAVLFKQSALLLAPVMITFLVLNGVPRRPAQVWRRSMFWLAGFAAPLILFAGYLLAQGSLAAFADFLSGAERLALFAGWPGKATALWVWSSRRPLVPLALAATAAILWQRKASAPLLILLWSLAEAGALFLPAQLELEPGGLSHYAIPALASASALASLSLALFWPFTHSAGSRRFLVPALLLVAVALTAPGWFVDTGEAWLHTEYPQPNREQELTIGRAAALVTEPAEPIVVLANAIFYHWAERQPASRFFHWPDYLGSSELAPRATEEVTQALVDPATGAVLISRQHLEERIPAAVRGALWQHWVPAARFPYPYQRDLFLFLPLPALTEPSPPLAEFGNQIILQQVHARRLDADNLLVQLQWQRLDPPAADYTVFVHLLDDQGSVLAQDDSVPAVGFRPTRSWQPEEVVVDYHWIRLPASVDLTNTRLSVGLYLPETGERLLRDPLAEAGAGAVDSYTQSLQTVLE